MVMREELGLVGGHVDVDGAVGPAALAREAQVERFGHRVAAPSVEVVGPQHLEEEEPIAFGRQIGITGMKALAFHEVDELAIESLDADRPVVSDLGDVITGLEHVRVAEDDESPGRFGLDEADRRAEHDDARALRADEGLGDVEAGLGK